MSRSYEIVISAEAEKNIQEAVAWIAEANSTAATEWYEGLIQALGSLAKLPTRCPLAPESKLGLIEREVRHLIYGRSFWKYRILFAIEGRRVLVAHVRHGARLYLRQEENEENE